MKIIFFGTGKFGLPTLKKLMQSRHDVLAVVTQPDSSKGRGWNVLPTSVKAFIEKAAPDIEVLQPSNVSDAVFTDHMRSKDADVFVVVDYGQFLDKELLELPKKYSVNLHPSLLPAYRGAAPVNWAILNGDRETGNTVIKMAEKMDAGDIIAQEKTPISEEENAPELIERLAKSGADLLLKTLDLIESGKARPMAQDEAKVSYAPKLQKKDGKIDWEKPASDLIRKIKGMQPWPDAFTLIDGKVLKIFKASVLATGEEEGTPGTVLDENEFVVKAGKDALRIDVLQVEGKRKMPRKEFLRGQKIARGKVLGV